MKTFYIVIGLLISFFLGIWVTQLVLESPVDIVSECNEELNETHDNRVEEIQRSEFILDNLKFQLDICIKDNQLFLDENNEILDKLDECNLNYMYNCGAAPPL